MTWLDYLIDNSLKEEYPNIIARNAKIVFDEDDIFTAKKILRNPENIETFDIKITSMMTEWYKKNLHENLTSTYPIFLLDWNNKQESHIIYELLKQILDRYLSIIERNKDLSRYLTYIDIDYRSWDDIWSILSRFYKSILYKEQAAPSLDNKVFWSSRVDFWSNPQDLVAYSLRGDIFELLAECLNETKENLKNGISYCYCINPEWFTYHEQKILARILERGYLKSFSKAHCFLKINNIKWWRNTYRSFDSNSPIQSPHDYLTYSFAEEDISV